MKKQSPSSPTVCSSDEEAACSPPQAANIIDSASCSSAFIAPQSIPEACVSSVKQVDTDGSSAATLAAILLPPLSEKTAVGNNAAAPAVEKPPAHASHHPSTAASPALAPNTPSTSATSPTGGHHPSPGDSGSILGTDDIELAMDNVRHSIDHSGWRRYAERHGSNSGSCTPHTYSARTHSSARGSVGQHGRIALPHRLPRQRERDNDTCSYTSTTLSVVEENERLKKQLADMVVENKKLHAIIHEEDTQSRSSGSCDSESGAGSGSGSAHSQPSRLQNDGHPQHKADSGHQSPASIADSLREDSLSLRRLGEDGSMTGFNDRHDHRRHPRNQDREDVRRKERKAADDADCAIPVPTRKFDMCG